MINNDFNFDIEQKVRFSINNSMLIPLNHEHDQIDLIKLDNLESIVLEVLLKNANLLVSYNELLSHWRSKMPTESSLARVVSVLRTKLKKAGIQENIIINTPKRGYTLNGKIYTSDLNIKHQIKEVKANTKVLKKMIPITAVFVIFIFVLSASLIEIQSGNPTELNLKDAVYTDLVDDTNTKEELTQNALNNYLAYASKSLNDRYWHIIVLSPEMGQSLSINSEGRNIKKPVWIDRDHLVYRSYDEQTCEIKIALLNYDEKSFSENRIFSCNPNSYGFSIARYDDNHILFAEAEFNSVTSILYKGNLSTGKIERIDVESGNGVGIYHVETSINSRLVVLLSSSDGVSFTIRLVDPNDKWKTVWKHRHKANNYSVGWDGTLLSYRNTKGGLSLVEFRKNREVNRIHVPLIQPVHSISASKKGIILTSEEYYREDMQLVDLESNKSILLSTEASKNSFAQFYSANHIIYVSNRLGVEQVLLYNMKSNSSRQLTSFTQQNKIKNLAFDNENRRFALEMEGEVTVFEVNDNYSSSDEIYKTAGRFPTFFDSGLVISKFSNDTPALYFVDLTKQNELALNIDGGFFAREDDGKLYYSKLYSPGIWKYNQEGLDKLVFQIPSTSYKWFINQAVITYKDDQGNFYRASISNPESLLPISSNCSAPTDFHLNKCLSIREYESRNRIVSFDLK